MKYFYIIYFIYNLELKKKSILLQFLKICIKRLFFLFRISIFKICIIFLLSYDNRNICKSIEYTYLKGSSYDIALEYTSTNTNIISFHCIA